MKKIVAFDVETPNGCNNRICSIGLSVLEEGRIVWSKNYLINPECSFDDRNIAIHNISPKDVANAPTFPTVWEEIHDLFEENIICAHNAQFDLGVLRKTLEAYGIEVKPMQYLCTLRIARQELPMLLNFRLPTLCEHFDIFLTHHNSLSDSNACVEILNQLMQDGLEIEKYLQIYQVDDNSTDIRKKKPSTPAHNTQAIAVLQGIVSGIICDNVLSNEEVSYLNQWLIDNKDLTGNYPYDVISTSIEKVLEDGVIAQEERSFLMEILSQAFDPVGNDSCVCHSIEINGKTFCLTGEFDYGQKSAVEALLYSQGGIPTKTVSGKTNVLIVGGQGSSAWCAGNYGTKVKKALELQEKGSPIQIVREHDVIK